MDFKIVENVLTLVINEETEMIDILLEDAVENLDLNFFDYDDTEIKELIQENENNIKELKNLIPTKISEIQNDSGYVSDYNYIHTDNNYTDIEKIKLENLQNYNDTEIKQNILELNNDFKILESNIDVLSTNKADKNELPINIAELNQDDTHRVVTDIEKNNWNNKANIDDIPDVTQFITKTVDDLDNYYKKSEVYNKIEIDLKLENKPKINGVELDGDKTTKDLNFDYNDINNTPQIKILNSTNDEVIIDIKGVKKLQELGIAPFRLLDMKDYTDSNPLIPVDEIIDGTYMTVNAGYIKTSTENLKLVENSILIKFDTTLTIITDTGNYWYSYSADGYEGSYTITYSEIEDMLSSFINRKSIVANNATTITLNNNFWYQKNISTGLTKLTQKIPVTIDTNYEVKVSLNTSSTSFVNTIQNNSNYEVKFIGLDCENGEWNPRTNMRYNLDYYFDGVYIVCNVTGFERS